MRILGDKKLKEKLVWSTKERGNEMKAYRVPVVRDHLLHEEGQLVVFLLLHSHLGVHLAVNRFHALRKRRACWIANKGHVWTILVLLRVEHCHVVKRSASHVELFWWRAIVVRGQRRDELVRIRRWVLHNHLPAHATVDVAEVVKLRCLRVFWNGDLHSVGSITSFFRPLVFWSLEDRLVHIQPGGHPIVPVLVCLARSVDAVQWGLLHSFAWVTHVFLLITLSRGWLLKLWHTSMGSIWIVRQSKWMIPVRNIFLDESVLNTSLDFQGWGNTLASFHFVLVFPQVHFEHELIVFVGKAILSYCLRLLCCLRRVNCSRGSLVACIGCWGCWCIFGCWGCLCILWSWRCLGTCSNQQQREHHQCRQNHHRLHFRLVGRWSSVVDFCPFDSPH